MADKIISETFKVPVGKILLEAAPANMEWKLIPKEKSEVEKLQEQLAQAEAELEGMTKPDDKELIEWGKASHPYYNLYYRIEMLRGLLNESL
jgi:hypothetical protein